MLLAGLPNCTLRKGDMYALPFADEEFDTAVLDDVLNGAEDPLAVVFEARRLLKAGGRLLFLSSVDAEAVDAGRSRFAAHARAAGLRLAAPKALPAGRPRWLLAVATRPASRRLPPDGNWSSVTMSNLPVQVSFEFFPPNTAAMNDTLWHSVERLAPLAPRFVSVTYGADGSTRERTHTIVGRIASDTALTAAPHRPASVPVAVKSTTSRASTGTWASGTWSPCAATRRRAPRITGRTRTAMPMPRTVAGLRRIADFDISVAAYPEVHPEAASALADLDNLKRKMTRARIVRSRSSFSTSMCSCISGTGAPRPGSTPRSYRAFCR